MLGRICVKDYKINCIIGVHPYEREKLQEVALEIEVDFDMTQGVLSDSIVDSVDYEKLVKVFEDLAHSRRYHLLETFAFEGLNEIFSVFPIIQWARVSVKKKGALLQAKHAAVILEKKREE